MKKFKIELIDSYGKVRRKINCGHLDLTRKITVLSDCEIKRGVDQNECSDIIWVGKLDHFNIFENMITLYYEDGETVEITRIND